MDICCGCGKSVYYLDGFSDQKQCTCNAIGESLIDDLENTLNESFHIQDAQKPTSLCIPRDVDDTSHIGKGITAEESDDGDDVSYLENQITGEELEVHETESVSFASQKSLCEYETFPPTGKLPSYSMFSDEEEEEEDLGPEFQINNCMEFSNTAYPRSISLPAPLKLVSAMKGSREKQGTEPKKLTVTWAADVYDPPPTSLSHVVKSKNHQRSKVNNKKNGKNKQKGKVAARGSTGKDKKQLRKLSGSSDVCFKSLDARDRLVYDDFTDPDDLDDFGVGSPDPYCGSSFLKKSLGKKVHISVAEAL